MHASTTESLADSRLFRTSSVPLLMVVSVLLVVVLTVVVAVVVSVVVGVLEVVVNMVAVVVVIVVARFGSVLVGRKGTNGTNGTNGSDRGNAAVMLLLSTVLMFNTVSK